VTSRKESWSQTSLPIRRGGLGLCSATDLFLPCFLSSSYACTGFVKSLLASPNIKPLIVENVGYWLHRRVTLLPGQKPSQLLMLETCSALMSSVLQLSSELVPKLLKARNATVVKLLIS